MPLVIPCPSCKAKIKVPEAAVGKKVKCPGCQSPLTVRDPDATPAPPPREPARVKAPPPPPAEVLDDLEEIDDRLARPLAKGSPKSDFADLDDRPARGRRDDADEDFDDVPAKKSPGKWAPRGGPTTESERSTAMLLWLLNLLGVGIVSLILWFSRRKESRFIDHHGKMLLNVAITGILEGFLLMVLIGLAFGLGFGVHWVAGLVVGGLAILLAIVLSVWNLIQNVMGLIGGKNGEWFVPRLTLKLLK